MPEWRSGAYAQQVGERRVALINREELSRRQRALADYGDLVLRVDDLQQILTEGCRLIAQALNTDLAKILEIEPDRTTALVVAGVGWMPDIIGKTRIKLNERSSESYALDKARPVITQDITKETRFEFPAFMRAHRIVALVNVPIFLPGGQAFGLLQVDAREPREFGDDDIQFLRTYATILGPLIDRLRKVRELEANTESFRLVVDSARDYAILLTDPQDVITDWFAGAEAIFGWAAHEIIGQHSSVLFTEEDQQTGVPELETETARKLGAAPNVRWHRRKNGRRVFIEGQSVALRGSDGTLRGFMKIGQDTTERRRAQERQGILLAELQHRVRNVLAMVRSVISKGNGASVKEFRSNLEGRIMAMARTQALLTRGADVRVDLECLISDELLTHVVHEGQVTISGSPVTLAPKAAEVLTLAIHELVTNALKYGALGQAEGRLDVSWSRKRDGDHDWLYLIWQEHGVQVAAAAPPRIGFGTELITKRVPYELRGRGSVDFEPGGARCTISFPLLPGESIFQSDSPAAFRDTPNLDEANV